MDCKTIDIINEWGMEPKQAPTHVGERFVRFMPMDEYCKFMDGWTLRNDRDHSLHADTNSVGFCFVRVEDDETCRDAVKRAAEYLSGTELPSPTPRPYQQGHNRFSPSPS